MDSFKKCIAEFIGTFTLVLVGCGTAMITGCEQWGGYLTTAFAFGLVIVGMAYCVGNVSDLLWGYGYVVNVICPASRRVSEINQFSISECYHWSYNVRL